MLDRPALIGLARWWWTFILRGVLAIAFGVLAFLAPQWGIEALVVLFAAWAIVDGAGSLVAGISTRGEDRSWWLEMLEGLAGIAAGIIALLFPIFAATALVWLIGAFAIAFGVFEIGLGWRLQKLSTQAAGDAAHDFGS